MANPSTFSMTNYSSTSSPITSSYQLPDLLSLTRRIELRTNKHCRSVTLASEKWLLEDMAHLLLLEEEERQKVPSLKVGLLASLCFPTCDSPQLRLATDFWTLLMCENERLLRGSSVDHVELVSGWWCSAGSVSSTGSNALEALGEHLHFKHLAPQITRLSSTMSTRWNEQFSRSISALREAQMQTAQCRQQGSVMGTEEYLSLRRSLSGLPIMFCLVEAVEGLNLDAVYQRAEDAADLAKMRDMVADVIALSWDIFAYNIDQSLGNTINLVHIFVKQHRLVAGGAIHQASSLVRQLFQEYMSVETEFCSRHPGLNPPYSSSTSPSTSSQASQSLPSSLSSWIWGSLSPSSTSSMGLSTQSGNLKNVAAYDNTTLTDLSLFLLGLKDCLVGCLNWSYETQVFFGTKGDSVRGYGWVFLLPKKVEGQSGML